MASGEEPPAAEAPAADPARADPGRADPARADPGRADPARADPARADPARAEPDPAEPALGPAAEALDARPGRAPAGELTSALCALALLVAMVATKWYGVVALPRSADRSGIQSAASAWSELGIVAWVMVLCVAATLGSVALHVSQRSHGSQTDTSALVAAVGTLTAALLFYRVVVALPAPDSVVDAKLGAYLGLLAAVGVGLGGVESVLDRRRRRLRAGRRHRQHGQDH